jgi:hypothetical protein
MFTNEYLKKVYADMEEFVELKQATGDAKAEAMLKSGPLQNNTKLAYKNTAAVLDQNKAWDSAKRELRRKGVEGDALYNELRRRTSNTAENSFKELNRRVNKISKPYKFKNFIKNVGKRIGKRI